MTSSKIVDVTPKLAVPLNAIPSRNFGTAVGIEVVIPIALGRLCEYVVQYGLNKEGIFR
jgi:hypothetical protein